MSDTTFWILLGITAVVGLSLVGRVFWLQYKEWREFDRILISDDSSR